MSGFKRNSSRFGGGNSEGSSSGRSTGGSKFGGKSGGSSGGGKKYPFTRIGSLTVPKSLAEKDEQFADSIKNELRGSDIRLNLQIYPPKGVEEVRLKRGDIVSISFNVNDKYDKEFVLGHASIANND